jgi:hypothetical protein
MNGEVTIHTKSSNLDAIWSIVDHFLPVEYSQVPVIKTSNNFHASIFAPIPVRDE